MKKALVVFVCGFSSLSWSQGVTSQAEAPFVYQGKEFMLEWEPLSEKGKDRMFGNDNKRFTKIRDSLSTRSGSFVDLKKHMSDVRSQGARGTCSNFAAMALLEHLFNKAADISEQCLAYFASDEDASSFLKTLGIKPGG